MDARTRSDLHDGGDLWTVCRSRERWQRLFLRPLRLSGIQAWKSTGPTACSDDLFAGTAKVRLQQTRHADRLLQTMRLSFCLQRRLSKESVHQDTGRPART